MRTLATNNQTGVALPVTEPVFLVEINYSTVVRLSTRDTLIYDDNLFTGVRMSVSLKGVNASIKLWNKDLAHGATLISEGPDQAVTIYEAYGQGPFASSDVDNYYDGVVASGSVDGEYVNLELIPSSPMITPRSKASASIFSFLPANGTEIVTLAGTFVLRGENN